MIFHIFRYEWKKLSADNLLRVSAILIVLLITAALFNGKRWYDFETRTLGEIAVDYREQADTTRRAIQAYSSSTQVVGINAPQNPSNFYASYTLNAGKALKPIAVFSIGQSDLYSNYAVFSARDKTKLIQDDEIQNSVHLMTGKFDLAFVIIYIFPLLIITWSYDLYSGEAERKTTVLIRSYGFSFVKYIFYKAVFQFILIVGLFSSTLVILIALIHPALLSPAQSMDLVMFWLLTTGYFLFWLSLAVIVNSFKQSSLFNGVVLVSAWVVLLLLVPYVISFKATSMFPVPSREIQALNKRKIAKEVDRDKALEKLTRQNPAFRRFMTDTTVQLIFEASHGYPKYVSYQKELEERYRLMEDSALNQLLQQEQFCIKARFSSPSLTVAQAMNSLAATGTINYIGYFKSREEYYQTWRQENMERVLMKVPVSLTSLDDIPAFQWRNTSPYRSQQAGADLTFLIVFSGLLLFVSYLKYRKM